MKTSLGTILLLFITTACQADFPFALQHQELKTVYQNLTDAGLPDNAARRYLEFIDQNQNRMIQVKANKISDKEFEKHKIQLANNQYGAIIDYSLPSNQRRLYFINFKTAQIEKYFVAHGVGTGITNAVEFSNQNNSKKTSLGFFVTGSTYDGSHGESLLLYGIEPSNDRAFDRDIVMHGAGYVSMDMIHKYGRMGRSWGCPAVSIEIGKKIIPLLQKGGVIYSYHKELMATVATSPTVQIVSSNQENTPNDRHHIVPEEMNP